jgi:hypothetical protein
MFRAVAVLLGLAPSAATEALVRAFGLGRPDLAAGPFIGLSACWPLFVADRTGRRYAIPPAPFTCFQPASFEPVKPAGEFRIVCLGGARGGGWLVDQVHPSSAGHEVPADALTKRLAQQGIVHPDRTRVAERRRRHRARLTSLNAAHYLVGPNRLGNLRLWTAGRGTLERPPDARPSAAPAQSSSEPATGRAVGASR